MAETTFTDENFDSEVIKSSIPVLVDFWAPWCGPCRIQGPIIEALAREQEGKSVKIGKLNVDENPQTAQSYNVMSIPTIIVFKDGQVAQQIVGVQQKDALKKALGL
ncbi:thioredoxin [Candidatus Uhrbacteria bacterium RIFCSPLOWO2_02_FULL_49_11]|uniref:Thioredoxin n=1 Tax=Candidatus Uhrbacteria bacterium RIFCSPLOWO2_02_FULL_49_11 TaxID=1802409 RepID=A0A1F7VEW6_9BACT|nr:MAG: thioredoxin [Candidatus Uhrbacteria bacterium RIFCSPLOWO2_02_FULL_49_11]